MSSCARWVAPQSEPGCAMANPKVMPFSRVRLLECTDSGLLPRVEDRRAGPSHRSGLPLPWRQLLRTLPAAPEGALPRAADAEWGQARGDADDVANASEPPPRPPAAEQLPKDPLGSESPAGPRADDLITHPPSVAHRPGRKLVETKGVAPIAAIARAVEESSALESVADLVVRTCDGDNKRETGPWEFTLALQAQGLGRSLLRLHLSRELLKLRFECDGLSLRDLLWRHSKSLQSRIEERLQIPLEIDVELGDG